MDQSHEWISHMNVDEIVKTRFAAITNLALHQIAVNADVKTEYGIDSVKALRLISDVEVEFDIDISQDEARNVQTLNEMIGLIKTKLA